MMTAVVSLAALTRDIMSTAHKIQASSNVLHASKIYMFCRVRSAGLFDLPGRYSRLTEYISMADFPPHSSLDSDYRDATSLSSCHA